MQAERDSNAVVVMHRREQEATLQAERDSVESLAVVLRDSVDVLEHARAADQLDVRQIRTTSALLDRFRQALRFQTAGQLEKALAQVPEPGRELAAPLQRFMERLRAIPSSTDWLIFLGITGSGGLFSVLMANASGVTYWASFLGLLVFSPLFAVLPVVRDALAAGFTRTDLIDVMTEDIARQREARAKRLGPEKAGKVGRWIVKGGAASFGVGLLLAVSGLDLPVKAVMYPLLIGALSMLAGGGLKAWRDRRGNPIVGERWLWLWKSRLGGLVTRLAGAGLDPRRPRKTNPWEILQGIIALLEARTRATPELLGDAGLQLMDGRVMDTIRQLEDMLNLLKRVTPDTVSEEELTKSIRAAQDICAVVDALKEARE